MHDIEILMPYRVRVGHLIKNAWTSREGSRIVFPIKQVDGSTIILDLMIQFPCPDFPLKEAIDGSEDSNGDTRGDERRYSNRGEQGFEPQHYMNWARDCGSRYRRCYRKIESIVIVMGSNRLIPGSHATLISRISCTFQGLIYQYIPAMSSDLLQY